MKQDVVYRMLTDVLRYLTGCLPVVQIAQVFDNQRSNDNPLGSMEDHRSNSLQRSSGKDYKLHPIA